MIGLITLMEIFVVEFNFCLIYLFLETISFSSISLLSNGPFSRLPPIIVS